MYLDSNTTATDGIFDFYDQQLTQSNKRRFKYSYLAFFFNFVGLGYLHYVPT